MNEKWGYCLGTFGNTLTQTLLSQKCTQANGVGTYNTSHRDYLAGFIGKRVSDCYGLVKGYLWTEGSNEPKYSATQDRNQEGAYNAARDKGPLSTLPEIPGIVLWMKGHAGIYIGHGEFIECAGCPTGVRKGTIKNGVVTSGSKFTNWFKDTFITYETPKATGTTLCIDGKVLNVPAENINGYLVIALPELGGGKFKIRDILASDGYTVTWEETSRTIVAVKK